MITFLGGLAVGLVLGPLLLILFAQWKVGSELTEHVADEALRLAFAEPVYPSAPDSAPPAGLVREAVGLGSARFSPN
ncbi:MAG: hypothetical protein HY329_24885 [Chloroflexi bacterium]|nr:hypothetical protein [Chloroflexota bacterium]